MANVKHEINLEENYLPTPMRATTDEIASARWCQALAFMSPLPVFSPALFVIQYNLVKIKMHISQYRNKR